MHSIVLSNPEVGHDVFETKSKPRVHDAFGHNPSPELTKNQAKSSPHQTPTTVVEKGEWSIPNYVTSTYLFRNKRKLNMKLIVKSIEHNK